MKETLRKLVAKISRGQKGFTLIEMIVVVGIIAVLAAVIVPNMGNFIGQGKEGAMEAEWDSLQTAMNAMMANEAISSVDALEGAVQPVQDWTSYPEVGGSTQALDSYLQSGTTTYFYCYNAQGNIIAQFEDASENCDSYTP